MARTLVLISIFALLVVFPSCKKQHSCLCTTKYEKPGYNPYTVSAVQKIDSKTTKKRAEQICSHTEKQLYKNSLDYKAGDETLTTACAVK